MQSSDLKSLSTRAKCTTISPMRILAPAARSAKERGVKVYHMNIGEPCLDAPPSFFKGLELINLPNVGYEETQGSRLLRKAWSSFYANTAAIDLPPENILITNGASEAVFFALSACCEAGDEVLIFDPSYANYLGLAVMAGVKLVPLPRRIEDDFKMPSITQISAHISSRTKAILLCNPDNPTGKVYGRKELEDLLNLCHEKKLFLIVDEVYREFVYEDRHPLSLLNISPRNKRIILIDSLSKRFSLCGARLGCLATFNEEILLGVLVFASLRLSSPVIEQYAAAYMLEHLEADYLPNAVAAFERQRTALCQALSTRKDLLCPKPEGAFYATIKVPLQDSLKFAAFLLNDFTVHGETVFVTPAGGFYFGGDGGFNELRLAFVMKEDEVRKAALILLEGIDEYNARIDK